VNKNAKEIMKTLLNRYYPKKKGPRRVDNYKAFSVLVKCPEQEQNIWLKALILLNFVFLKGQ
jgi:hypothetical protein